MSEARSVLIADKCLLSITFFTASSELTTGLDQQVCDPQHHFCSFSIAAVSGIDYIHNDGNDWKFPLFNFISITAVIVSIIMIKFL